MSESGDSAPPRHKTAVAAGRHRRTRSITPARRERDLRAFRSFSALQYHDRIPHQRDGDSRAEARVESVSREPHSFAWCEHPRRVVKAEQFDLEQARRPNQSITGFHAAENLSRANEPAVVVATQ